jgi:hypothetical protein
MDLAYAVEVLRMLIHEALRQCILEKDVHIAAL